VNTSSHELAPKTAEDSRSEPSGLAGHGCPSASSAYSLAAPEVPEEDSSGLLEDIDEESCDEFDRATAAHKLRQLPGSEAPAALSASAGDTERATPGASRTACNDTTLSSSAFEEDEDPLAHLGLGDSGDEDSDAAILEEIDEELLEDSDREASQTERNVAGPSSHALDEAAPSTLDAAVSAFSARIGEGMHEADVSSEDEIELEVRALTADTRHHRGAQRSAASSASQALSAPALSSRSAAAGTESASAADKEASSVLEIVRHDSSADDSEEVEEAESSEEDDSSFRQRARPGAW
jgi:hypothetical protein